MRTRSGPLETPADTYAWPSLAPIAPEATPSSQHDPPSPSHR